MIKLNLPEKPIELTEEIEKNLIEQFKTLKKDVWNKKYIKDPLKKMTHEKCSYCEVKLNTQGAEIALDHYHNKEDYPDEVVKWGNLLPSCKNCNSHKGRHDTLKEPILNPVIQNPKDYIYLKDVRIKSKDNDPNSIGRLTITLLDLNNREKLVNPRTEIACLLDDKLEILFSKIVSYEGESTSNQRTINFIKKQLRGVLRLAQPDEEYSAYIAAILMNDDNYLEIQTKAHKIGIWDEEMEEMHATAMSIKLDYYSNQPTLSTL